MTVSKPEINSNMTDNYKQVVNSATSLIAETDKAIETITSNSSTTPVQVTEDLNKKEEEFKFPELTLENINTTFKVIGDLKEGSKLKLVNDRYLAEDNTFMPSLSRYSQGQGREKIMSFLSHLFDETKRIIGKLIDDISKKSEVDTNISELDGVIYNMSIFLHRYDIMRAVYRNDTGTHAKSELFEIIFSLSSKL